MIESYACSEMELTYEQENDPETGTWAAAGLMKAALAGHVPVVLRGNRGALVIGGLTRSPAPTDSLDIFELCSCPELN
jgi:hypothetical protein